MRKPIVAIDGPSGAGKSTLAKLLARQLGLTYIDTGAMYRAFALKVIKQNLDVEDEAVLKKILEETKIELREDLGRLRVFLDGADVSEEIRDPEASQMASKVSTLRVVREKMFQLQRALGAAGGVVAEGRDMGTVVFPDADIKVFLDASAEVRARRRFDELRAAGRAVAFEEILREQEERDRRDSARALAPLRRAAGALVIDSSDLTADGVADRVIREVKQKFSKNN